MGGVNVLRNRAGLFLEFERDALSRLAPSQTYLETLERDFEDTLVYSQLETVPREWIRTPSLLERTNRELRRTFRQAVTFGRMTGADAALFLQVQRLHARLSRCSLVASLS